MQSKQKREVRAALAETQSILDSSACTGEAEIVAVAHHFRRLAGQADTILQQASAIVSCVEDERLKTVLTKVQSLCLSIKPLLVRRIEAASAIRLSLEVEQGLLAQLTLISRHQQSIAFHLKALSVLTDVEVAHLGADGGAFQILSRELSTFSRSVSEQTQELKGHTDECGRAVKTIRQELAANLPQLQSELSRIEQEVQQTLRLVEAGLTQLAELPVQFRLCAEQTSQQIDGVVAAIQAHDITRQQVEHVRQALHLIASAVPENGASDQLPSAYGGLMVQVQQLQAISQTITSWVSQIEQCVGGIQRLSSSELLEIGPAVLRQERELSTQLAHVEHLEQKSQDYGRRIKVALEGVSRLLDLVNEHLARSQNIRRRLQLLMLNSYVEADRLGERGAAVLAISHLIKQLFLEWNLITDDSNTALKEIVNHSGKMSTAMEIFSDNSTQALHADQERTREVLSAVRDAAEFVASEAVRMHSTTNLLQATATEVRNMGSHLNVCFGRLDGARTQIQAIVENLEKQDSQIAGHYSPDKVEQWFAGLYTTEAERQVLSAALRGTAPPAQQVAFTGNDVELF